MKITENIRVGAGVTVAVVIKQHRQYLYCLPSLLVRGSPLSTQRVANLTLCFPQCRLYSDHGRPVSELIYLVGSHVTFLAAG